MQPETASLLAVLNSLSAGHPLDKPGTLMYELADRTKFK